MRFKGVALVASVMVLGACGGETKAPETKAPEAPAPAAATPAAGASAAAGTAMPITGKTIEVKMYGDAKGYRFEPANITAKVGDGIRFIVENGGPHNVAFDATKVPADAKAQLDANFGTDRMGELSSGLKMAPGESFTLSLGGVKAGKYDFNCTPHLAMGMKGTLTVTP
jgi:plastocyanin